MLIESFSVDSEDDSFRTIMYHADQYPNMNDKCKIMMIFMFASRLVTNTDWFRKANDKHVVSDKFMENPLVMLDYIEILARYTRIARTKDIEHCNIPLIMNKLELRNTVNKMDLFTGGDFMNALDFGYLACVCGLPDITAEKFFTAFLLAVDEIGLRTKNVKAQIVASTFRMFNPRTRSSFDPVVISSCFKENYNHHPHHRQPPILRSTVEIDELKSWRKIEF